MRALPCILLLLAFAAFAPAKAGENNTNPDQPKIVLAVAHCHQFSGLDDLPRSRETVAALSHFLTRKWNVLKEDEHFWENGTAESFASWLESIPDAASRETILVLYFASHQWKSGMIRFSSGPELQPETFISRINQLSSKFQHVLFISDCCHGGVLETKGRFEQNVSRLYAAGGKDMAEDVHFTRGPFGIEAFAAPALKHLNSIQAPKVKGMSLLSLFLIRGLVDSRKTETRALDPKELFDGIIRARADYQGTVRSRKLQTPEFFPAGEP
jgi:hypothetical protein